MSCPQRAKEFSSNFRDDHIPNDREPGGGEGGKIGWDGERERERERQTDRQTDRQTETEKQTGTEREGKLRRKKQNTTK